MTDFVMANVMNINERRAEARQSGGLQNEI
jgi:hypothetical protein